MIALSNVTCMASGDASAALLLDDVSLIVRPMERVGILAPAGSGKSTIARLLCGIEPPSAGEVLIEGRTSWPMGAAGFLHPELSGETNILLVAKMIGEDPMDLVSTCVALTRQDDGFRKPLKEYSPTVRAALAFALSIGRICDYYIADDRIGVGDGDDRMRFSAMLDSRLENAGLVFLSRTARYLEERCSRFFVLHAAKLIEVDSAATASAVLELVETTEADSASGNE